MRQQVSQTPPDCDLDDWTRTAGLTLPLVAAELAVIGGAAITYAWADSLPLAGLAFLLGTAVLTAAVAVREGAVIR